MIRIEQEDGWTLIRHQDHAIVAGEFARHWNNRRFGAPEPFEPVRLAVACHDDSWAEPDSQPGLYSDGTPSAFSEDLVGTYDAFENIDLPAYLAVRKEATEAAARQNPYAAIIVSMHTVNLLTEQADLDSLTEEQKPVHAAFIEGQLQRQAELAAICKQDPALEPYADQAHFQRAFEFLQACDSLSLMCCTAFSKPTALRHTHPDSSGERVEIQVLPQGGGTFRLSPSPFDEPELTVSIPCRFVKGKAFSSDADLRERYHAAEPSALDCVITA
ncbi:MAG: DUF3891 family protein [Opitutales bacterium]